MLSRQRRGTAITGTALALLLVLAGCKQSVEQLVAEASALRDAGDFPGAAIKLKNALVQDPKNIPGRLLAAQIYVDLERGDAALGLLLRARQEGVGERELVRARAEAELAAHRYQEVLDDTAHFPAGLSSADQASLLAYRGAALGMLGRLSDAEEALARGLALDPHSVDVRIAAARLAINRGDVEGARRQSANARRDGPKDRRLTRLDGDIAYVAGDFTTAEGIYQKILDREKWNDRIRGQLAAVQVAQGKLPEAIANLDAVLRDPKLADVPKHPILNYIRALAAFRQQDYAAAQSNAAVVVAKVPTFEPARKMAGASSYALHAFEQAYYYLSAYVSQDPGDIQAHKLLAQTQLELGRPGDAAKTLAPLRDKAGDDPDLLRLFGVASARSGDAQTANRYLRMALEKRPGDRAVRTELGILEVATGDPRSAIENLEQIVGAHPDGMGPQIPLFVAFVQTKEYDKALAIAEQLIQSQPNDPTGQLFASTAYLLQGNVKDARAALLKARDIRPGDVNANRTLATLALADGKVDEARRYYQDILVANPHSTQSYVELAELDANANLPEDAETVLRQGVLANPTDPAISIALAKFQLAYGKTEDAGAGAREALKRFPRNPALLDAAGRAELALGRRDAALSTFKDLVTVAPDAAASHTGLAEAYLALYAPDNPQWSAVNEATEAVKLDPRDARAKLVLARALALHGRFVEASKVVDELRGMRPQDPEVIELEGIVARGQGAAAEAAAAFARAEAVKEGDAPRRLAQTELRLGHTDKAAKRLTDWIASHPDDGATRRMWAETCVSVGRLAEASGQYAELVRREPKEPNIRNNLAWVLSRLGKGQEALTHARVAVALAPESVEFRDTLGTILLQVGKADEAVESLEKAWQQAASRADIGFHLSQALAAAGRKDEAKAVLRRLLTGNDSFTDRGHAQGLLRQLGG